VRHELGKYEQVCAAELFGLQGFKQIGTAGAQTSRQVQYLPDGFLGDQRFDHGTSSLTVNIGHHHIEPDTGVGEQLVQPVLLGSQHATELSPLAGNQGQVADVGLRDERGPQQPGTRQGGEPLRIGYIGHIGQIGQIGQIGLAPGHGLDVSGVDDPGGDAHALQCRIGTLPVTAGALHDHHLGTDQTISPTLPTFVCRA